ncbi:AAA family ATPase [Pseudoalteromonas sp. PB2-1]|uniref:AAA family ATPase n=1 Tax=Pseudoalteromonas sp. PB2-1 TaxID=2907242 RepID=UPI00386F9B4B
MTLPFNIFRAVYQESEIERYKGNPFIEALPRVSKVEELKTKLEGKVKYNPAAGYLDARERAHELCGLLDDFFQPLSMHVALEEKIALMIRGGYVARNIATGQLQQHLQNGYERLMTGNISSFRFAEAPSTARCLSLIGCSGCGKSSSVLRILATYPQAIYHEKYNTYQLTYLRIECPVDGSLKSLCLNFFQEVDKHLNTDLTERYGRKRHSTEVLLSFMGQVANQYAIGVLVIDEIQRLGRKQKEGQERMLEFFVALVNIIGVPVILVGTPKARPIFELELQSARRSTGIGSMVWEPLPQHKNRIDKVTGKPKSTEWRLLTGKLWQYQWLIHRDEPLTEEIRNTWFELSQGVLDIVVKLFVLAQLRAIITGVERLSSKLFVKVYESELQPIHPMIEALKSGKARSIAKYSDLQYKEIDKRLLELSQQISEVAAAKSDTFPFASDSEAMRLYNLLLGMGCESELLVPLVQKAIKDHPNLQVRGLIPLVLEWYEQMPDEVEEPKEKPVLIKLKDWHTLPNDDLRFGYSQHKKQSNELYQYYKQQGKIFDMTAWLKQSV